MTIKQKLLYFLTATIIFVGLTAIEFFWLSDLPTIINDSWQTKLICFIVALVLLNPFIVYKIMDLLPFKVKGLKVASGIEDALKQEN